MRRARRAGDVLGNGYFCLSVRLSFSLRKTSLTSLNVKRSRTTLENGQNGENINPVDDTTARIPQTATHYSCLTPHHHIHPSTACMHPWRAREQKCQISRSTSSSPHIHQSTISFQPKDTLLSTSDFRIPPFFFFSFLVFFFLGWGHEVLFLLRE